MVVICQFPCPIRARLQETNYLRHSYWKYPGKTAGSSSRRHWNHFPPPAQSLSRSARRPPVGFQGRMQDVVCQLVGIGMVPWHVINLTGFQRAKPQGETFHVNTTHRHIWAMLSSALYLLYRFRSILPAVHSAYKLCPECAVPYRPRCWPAGVQRRNFTPVLEGCKPERMYTHHWAFTLLLLQYLALACTNAFRLLQQVSNRVFRFCESIWAEIFYDHYADYSHYNNVLMCIMFCNCHNSV